MWMSGADAMHEVHIRVFTRHGAFLQVGGGGDRLAVHGITGTSEVGIVALMKVSAPGTTRFARCVGWRTPISPRVKVADETGKPLRGRRGGAAMVKGPTVFKGYWNEHHRLHGVVIDGWWWTGDLAYRDRLNRYYQVDRDVDCIRTSAGPIYSLLAKEELLKHPCVHEAVVVGLPAEAGFQKPLIVLQTKPGTVLGEQDALRWIARSVPLPCACTDVMVVRSDADIPRGLTGKVLKRVLRDRYGAVAPVGGPRDQIAAVHRDAAETVS